MVVLGGAPTATTTSGPIYEKLYKGHVYMYGNNKFGRLLGRSMDGFGFYYDFKTTHDIDYKIEYHTIMEDISVKYFKGEL